MYKEKTITEEVLNYNGDYKLDYDLTNNQIKASDFVLNCIKNKKDCTLNAVTGAGKTEIMYPLIKYCIDAKLKIAITIPRKDVVIELSNRIKKDFPFAKVVSVYGGCSDELFGNIIVLTTHQLYRYKEYFDVIVIDEIDAFPFYKNDLLKHFLYRSLKGNVVYMSATIPKPYLKKCDSVYFLNKRYHGEKLDVAKISYKCNFKSLNKHIYKHKTGILIIYFPTIKIQMKFHKKLKVDHYLINSKISDRKEVLNEIHSKEYAIILSTLVLERGVTFKNTHVIVFNADHELFNYSNLVQISGRVGRHYLYPHGKIIFLVKRKNRQIRKAIRFIKECNE
jgi:competence protein ComFA